MLWFFFVLHQIIICMAVNIKNERVERLINEVAALTGESKTEAVRKALEERRDRLAPRRHAGGACPPRPRARSLAEHSGTRVGSPPDQGRGRGDPRLRGERRVIRA